MAARISSFFSAGDAGLASLSSSLASAFTVTGSGEAKIKASMMAFSSDMTGASYWTPGSGLRGRAPGSRLWRLTSGFWVQTLCFPLVDANRAECALLKDPDDLEANHLQQREKRDDHARARLDV